MRDASTSLDDVELFQGMNIPGAGFEGEDRSQVPAVFTGISGGADMRSNEVSVSDGLAPLPEEEIGVVTTIKCERSAV